MTLPLNADIRVVLLADHPEFLPELRTWFETEWADYYGPTGPGDAARDLAEFAQRTGLPVAVIAVQGGELCGIAALRDVSVPTQPPRSPWAAAGLVQPDRRGQGIGARLLRALEEQARAQGYQELFCGTNTADSLLRREGWRLLERVPHAGQLLGIYGKEL